MSRGKPFEPGKSGNPAGRPPGENKSTRLVRAAARELIEDGDYRDKLKSRLLSGKLHPSVETMLWYYAYGKPKETIEVSHVRERLSSLLGVPVDELPEIDQKGAEPN